MASIALLLPYSTLNRRRWWHVRSSGEDAAREMRVCTNRTCRRQGSLQILETLSSLSPPDLLVKPCGCLGRCGSGPNLVVLPQGLVINHCATPYRAAEIVVHFCGGEVSAASAALTALALRNRALSEIEKGNFSKAESSLTQAIELKPFGGLHKIFKDRSVARLGMLDYSGALEDTKKALDLAPNYLEAYICQGDVFVATGQYDLAEKLYLACLEMDPSLRRSKSFKARTENVGKKLVVEADAQ
ncbi:PREDICTED: uncharacterized protein LOC104822590 isoform X2 [Tarenaya hassleriana]|uniref:uncharacterized protein LOC104822590 isoform X2 n=1 Tax=Tarenaya hassleriana TaxID=28532 RepID=UPI00053C7A31|nr:PREDICTED: uncharacterized protein LOC104822590 isoform X2 [Tarenaya hassleriana]